MDGDEASGGTARRAGSTGADGVVGSSAALLGDNASASGSALSNSAHGRVNSDVDGLVGSDGNSGSGSTASISSAGASAGSSVARAVSSNSSLLAPEAQVRTGGCGRNSDGIGGGAGGRESGGRGRVGLHAVASGSRRGRSGSARGSSRSGVDSLGQVGGRSLVDSGGDNRLGGAGADGVGESHISGEGGVGSDGLGTSGTSSGSRSNTRAVSAGTEGSVGVDARVSRDTSAQGSDNRAGSSSAGLDSSSRALVCASGERDGNRGGLNR